MSEPRICDIGGRGLVFPIFEAEQHWSKGFRAVLYAIAMVYLFLGVNILADKFVASIEVITSTEKRTHDKDTGRVIKVMVWNSTVANLTLLALGSSAPEILLSIMESIRRGFSSGDLGPSTIVGSAAFNLFVIIAVCIAAIPSPETRCIKQQNVFSVTACFSLLAYLWLVFIVQICSPDVVEIWEAVCTLFFLPVLIFVSYSADVGRWPFSRRSSSLETWACKVDPTAGGEPEPTCGTEMPPAPMRAGVPGCVDEEWGACSTSLIALPGRPSGSGAGILAFDDDEWEVVAGRERREVTIPVFRQQGSAGLVACRCRTEGGTAVPGRDYLERGGELLFAPGVTHLSVSVELLPKRPGEESRQFGVVLDEVRGGAVLKPEGGADGQRVVLPVTILSESERQSCCGLGMGGVFDWGVFRDSMASWRNEVVEAVACVGQEDEEPSTLDWVFHVLGFPWKILFGLIVPPAGWMGGWLCFGLSLLCIGAVTSIVIDFAELFGCVVQIEDSITAVTFVALGTSMPDLFASVSAARADEWADASIVNVTGSNSVNVFVGIGIPWTMSAIYWSRKPQGVFVVHGGELAFSVVVFTIAALAALAVIRIRRVKLGGELGGPFGPKVLSALLMVLLWVFYVSLSVWRAVTKVQAFWSQVAAVAVAAVALEHIVIAAGVGLWLLSGRAARRRRSSGGDDGRTAGWPRPPPPPALQASGTPPAAERAPAPTVHGLVLLPPSAAEMADGVDAFKAPLPLGQPPLLAPQGTAADGSAKPAVEEGQRTACTLSFGAAARIVVALQQMRRRAQHRRLGPRRDPSQSGPSHVQSLARGGGGGGEGVLSDGVQLVGVQLGLTAAAARGQQGPLLGAHCLRSTVPAPRAGVCGAGAASEQEWCQGPPQQEVQ
uniref:Sodium/calcium exchanger membrane region domain-containing protein n=1 Tax=Alexandrium monilatum TaxID=311494 RepID=A0A7S4VBV7_9DINO|mmetsp:Transcript_57455/g.178458  ORF Transcript_57455/g.178458 Transcript_57455/m.178458 type:complete len:891 (+) Transcript_57455:69-2741(+)